MKLPKLDWDRSHKVYWSVLFSLLGIVCFLLLLEIGTFVWVHKFSPFEPVVELKIANVTDQGFSVAWISKNPVKGYAVRPAGDKKVYAEDNIGPSTVHLVSISALNPDSQYAFDILSNYGRKISASSQKTLPAVNALTLPRTVYGKVVDQNQKPAGNALVFLRWIIFSKPQVQSQLLATLTNSQGNYLFDLNNTFFPSLSGKDGQRLEITAMTEPNHKSEVLAPTETVQPVATIVLK